MVTKNRERSSYWTNVAREKLIEPVPVKRGGGGGGQEAGAWVGYENRKTALKIGKKPQNRIKNQR